MKYSSAAYRLAWPAAGVMVLASCAATALLSRGFVYGEAHADRPVLAVLAAYFLGWMGFATAAVLAMRSRPHSWIWVLVIGISGRLILLPSNLVLENDCYRYVLDGEAVKHGINPYRWAPDEIGEQAPELFRGELATHRAQLVLSRVGHPDVPTIYPPLAQGAFAVGAIVAPWNWMGQRLVFLAVDLTTMLALIALLRHTGKPYGWVVLYAWNPLILKEIANSAHVDALVALGLIACLLALMGAMRNRGSITWAGVAGGTLAGAVLAKLYPAILAPACILFLIGATRRNALAAVFLAAFSGAVIVGYLPFVGVGLDQLTAGLRVYLNEWQRNAGAFAILDRLVPWPRAVAAGIVLLGISVASALAYRARGDADRLVASVQLSLLTWFLFLPAAYPWYAIGLIAISVLRPRPWVIVLSGAFGMYYLHFWVDFQDLPATWHTWIAVMEHGAVWASLAAGGRWNVTSPSAPRESTLREED